MLWGQAAGYYAIVNAFGRMKVDYVDIDKIISGRVHHNALL